MYQCISNLHQHDEHATKSCSLYLQRSLPLLPPAELPAADLCTAACVLPQEPSLYRLYEAITHGGEAIKSIINEEFGDGIMSAIGEPALLLC